MSLTTISAPETDSARACSRRWGLGIFFLALLPALIAIWATPWFVTQDGPSHLYNAQILTRANDPNSTFSRFYRVRRDPLPNWAGHLSLVALLQVVPPRIADRVMTTVTLVGFAASIVWLRWRVVGWRGMPMAALLAVVLAFNIPWLLGFTSFMLGACLFPITLGIWWHGRDRLSRRVPILWGLVVLGYFSHLVSLGLTVVGVGILALFARGERRLARLLWTALGLLPLIPLGGIYVGLTREGGAMKPLWTHLTNPLSPRSWVTQITWADPITLAGKLILPFREAPFVGFALLAPFVVFLLAMALEAISMVWDRWFSTSYPTAWPDRRGWGILAAVLIVGGVACPDTLGESHGNYLPQRVLLFGLVALVPWLDLQLKSWPGRGAALALVWVVAIQSGFLWEYAATSNRDVTALLRARSAIGTKQRVATLLDGIPSRFRANPMLHADNLLGVDSENILWNNYETRHYYFPVQFRRELDRPDVQTLEEIALSSGSGNDAHRASLWQRELEAHHDSIDAILAWGKNPELDRISNRWFRPVFSDGNVRVLRPR